MQYYIDKSQLDSFTYGTISSTSFNFIIVKNDNLKGFENDIEVVEVPGRTGDLLIDNQRKKNKEINIEAYADLDGLGSAEEVAPKIEEWLCGEVTYKPLIFSNDLNKYEAFVVGEIETAEEVKDLLSIKFKFNCKKVVK